jgi:initiation factor 1A
MPPNAKGGKGYKKGKNDDADAQLLECNESQNQMYGRAMKSLGNRRFLIFCNDNKERICRVCGSMRKSQWVERGSIVLISLRDVSMSIDKEDRKNIDIGDIIGLVDPSLIGKMKKVDGINPLLFTNIEDRDSTSLKKSIKAQDEGVDEDADDFFTRGSDAESECEEEVEGEEDKAAKLKAKTKTRDTERDTARTNKYIDGDTEINIDDI